MKIQACLKRKKGKTWKIPSDSRQGLEFEVTYEPQGDNKPVKWTCTCEHFRYRGTITGTCKHIQRLEKTSEVCRWTEAVGPEQQTKSGKLNKICPRCGGGTYFVSKSTEEIKLRKKKKWTWTKE